MMEPLRSLLARLWLLASLTVAVGLAQTPTAAEAPEISTKDAPALFKARVNLVLVPVVVRDAKGQAVGTLTKDNFILTDKGKPQEITKFSVEKSDGKTVQASSAASTIPAAAPAESGSVPDVPERFVAYVFDDAHLQFDELARVREAAIRQLANLAKTDRAALYTTSGQNQVDFTDDTGKLRDALLRMQPRSTSTRSQTPDCPEISEYMADRIVNRSDTVALNAAALEYAICQVGPAGQTTPAQQAAFQAIIQSAKNAIPDLARRILIVQAHDTQVTFTVLKAVVHRMSAMPGQRIMVVISPGFITPDEQEDKDAVIDSAIRANVLINSLDARGLWTDATADASHAGGRITEAFSMLKTQYDHLSQTAQSGVLSELSAGTGGNFIENNNDFDSGLHQLVTAPEFYYVLGFSPQNLKLDGSLHTLKVTVKPPAPSGLNLQARAGFYAPRKLPNAEETARQEIADALFSREEMSDLPVELHAQFFKLSDQDATIVVQCRLDPKRLPFRKAEGRNADTLTIVTGVFDNNGKFLAGMVKTMDMKLKEETLGKMLAAGPMSVKTNFSVPPGTYILRLVVRDSEGQLMSAVNGSIAIQ